MKKLHSCLGVCHALVCSSLGRLMGGPGQATGTKGAAPLPFWLHWVFVAVHRFSLILVSVGYSLVAGASLIVEHGL